MQIRSDIASRRLVRKLQGIIGSLLFLFCCFPGGAQAFWPFSTSKVQNPAETAAVQAAELDAAIKRLSMDLLHHLPDRDPASLPLAHGLAVCTFVDLKKLTRTSSLGRYLAEQLMSEFQQQGYELVELRKSLSILIQEQRGEYGLSRKEAEISPAAAAGALLTGTYAVTDSHVLINAKIIDNQSARLLSSATFMFPRNQLTDELLADAASAVEEKQQHALYLKRLEP